MDPTDESDDFGDFEEGDDKTKLAEPVKLPEPRPEPKVEPDFTKPNGTDILQKPPKSAPNASGDINLFSTEDIDLFGQTREETKAEQLEKAKIECAKRREEEEVKYHEYERRKSKVLEMLDDLC